MTEAMPAQADHARPSPDPTAAPADLIERWSIVHVGDYEMPAPETLDEVARALHAIDEFLIEPIAKALKRISADSLEAARDRRIPEADRAATYENIGRLITWTDELRISADYLLGSIAEITLLAHEDLRTIAEGYASDRILEDPSWSARMRGFHGLVEA